MLPPDRQVCLWGRFGLPHFSVQEILALAKLPRHVWRVWEILGKQGLLPPKFVDPPVRTTNLSLFMNAVFVSVIVSFIYSNRVRDSGGNILRRADKLGL